MSGPRVLRLSTTPIKGMALHHPDHLDLLSSGAAGDRDFFLVDDHDRLVSVMATGRLMELTAEYDRPSRRLAVRTAAGESWEGEVSLGQPLVANFFGHHEVAGRVVLGPWSAAISHLAELRLRLVQAREPGAGSDVHPVTLLSQESVAELGRHSQLERIDARRFRMLIEFGGVPAHTEDSWNGELFQIGGAQVRVRGPVPRCAATTRNPEDGSRDLSVVRMIRGYRGVQDTELGAGVPFGVYATVEREGIVRVGDALIPAS